MSESEFFERRSEDISAPIKGILNIIENDNMVDITFSDVCQIMRDSNLAILTNITISGGNRLEAIKTHFASPQMHNIGTKDVPNISLSILGF